MSIYVVAPVMRHTFPDLEADPAAGRRYGVTGHVLKLVMWGIADHASDHGGDSYPSLRTLAEYAQHHTDTVNIALHALQELGYLEIKSGGPGKPNQYRVILERFERAAEPRTQRAGDPRTQRAGDPRTPDGSPARVRGPDPRASARVDPRRTVLPSFPSARATTDPVENPTRVELSRGRDAPPLWELDADGCAHPIGWEPGPALRPEPRTPDR